MKNRWKSKKNPWTNPWKIDENSKKNPQIELGRVLGPLGAPWGGLLASLSVLGASWERLESVLERLGASRWHPGAGRGPHMDPRKGPKSSKNRSKIALIFWSIFRCDFDPKMVTGWFPKPSKNGPKKCIIFRSFFHRFLDRSWGPKSLKMSTSCTWEAHFHKIAFSDSDLFLEAKIMKKGSQNKTKMA